jgi:multiple sugar transport system ATP-binding protein
VAVVSIDKLYKRYVGANEEAVKGISFTVADGEFMVLLGPSGCGKSTVLRMIAGLEAITSGTVSIDGRPVNHVPAKDRDIAMVFQSYALYPHMTVHNNLAFGLRRRGVPADEIDRRVRGVAEKLGLAPFIQRKPHALSGGQRQRVALGRAIVRDPKVFLFDEPLSNLDAALRVSTRNELIKQQHELGTTTIYVTHDQVEAMTMGDRICIMRRGEVVQIGRPLEVYRNPVDTFVARFLGNPPMNLLAARLEQSGDRILLRFANAAFPIASYSATALAPHLGKPVTLGVRPEDLYDAPPTSIEGRSLALATRVLAVEPLGAETLLVLAIAGSGEEVIARIGRDTALRSGSEAVIGLDTAAIHLFESSTTRAIANEPATEPYGTKITWRPTA